MSDVSLKGGKIADGAGGGIRTPDHLITNQALYRTELRQPDKEQIIALPVPAEQPRPLSRQISAELLREAVIFRATLTASII